MLYMIYVTNPELFFSFLSDQATQTRLQLTARVMRVTILQIMAAILVDSHCSNSQSRTESMSAWLPTLEPQTEHLPMYERLLRSLLSDINGGALGDGSPLPPQRKLAHSLGLSVGTVTRFYREAETLGVIAGHVGRGTRVTAQAEQSSRTREARSQIGHEPSLGFQPQMINLAHNEPSSELAMRAIEDAMALPEFARLMREETGYAAPAGHASHRQLFASWLGRIDLTVGWRDVVCCPGAHHALGLAKTIPTSAFWHWREATA